MPIPPHIRMQLMKDLAGEEITASPPSLPNTPSAPVGLPPHILKRRQMMEETPKVTSVALWRARIVLQRHNLFDTVNTYINDNKVTNPEFYQIWEYGNYVDRNSPLVTALGTMLNLTSEQVDALFEEAATLVV